MLKKATICFQRQFYEKNSVNSKLHKNSSYCYHFLRDQKYGVEEGHDLKNEVRKEKWIKKKLRIGNGANWRKDQGLEPVVMNTTIQAMPEWSDAESGFPGAPTPNQIRAKKVNLQLCQDIFDAAMLVKRAQNIKNE